MEEVRSLQSEAGFSVARIGGLREGTQAPDCTAPSCLAWGSPRLGFIPQGPQQCAAAGLSPHPPDPASPG